MKFDLQKDDRNIVILKFRPFNGMSLTMIIHLAQFDSWRRWRADQCGLEDGKQVFDKLLLHNVHIVIAPCAYCYCTMCTLLLHNVHYVAKLLAMCVFYECIISRIWRNSFPRAQRCPQTPWTSWSTGWEQQQCRDVCFLDLFKKTDFQEIPKKDYWKYEVIYRCGHFRAPVSRDILHVVSETYFIVDQIT